MGMTKEVRAEKYTEWLSKMADYNFRHLAGRAQAEAMGISQNTVYAWKAWVPAKQWEKWKEEEKPLRIKKEMEVDDSLFEKAKGGDVAAIKLWYQKELGWSEKQISEVTNKNGDLAGKTEAELYAEVLKGVPRDVLEKALKEKELTVVVPEAAVIESQRQ